MPQEHYKKTKHKTHYVILNKKHFSFVQQMLNMTFTEIFSLPNTLKVLIIELLRRSYCRKQKPLSLGF